MQPPRLDFDRINTAALSLLPTLLARLAPGGVVRGREYVVLNPRRTDHKPGSFSINLHSGRWADFSSGDAGGDPVSLVAYLTGTDQGTAARNLARFCGLEF
jgi:hypothetical protein